MRAFLCAAAMALIFSGCQKQEGGGWGDGGLVRGSHKEEGKAEFYYDLGTETVDVSQYSPRLQEGYRLFLSVCGTCHSPARPLNAPYAEEPVWRRFVQRMHVKMKNRGISLSRGEEEKIVEFLVYDSQERKVKRKEEFEKQSEALKRLFLEKTK